MTTVLASLVLTLQSRLSPILHDTLVYHIPIVHNLTSGSGLHMRIEPRPADQDVERGQAWNLLLTDQNGKA